MGQSLNPTYICSMSLMLFMLQTAKHQKTKSGESRLDPLQLPLAGDMMLCGHRVNLKKPVYSGKRWQFKVKYQLVRMSVTLTSLLKRLPVASDVRLQRAALGKPTEDAVQSVVA